MRGGRNCVQPLFKNLPSQQNQVGTAAQCKHPRWAGRQQGPQALRQILVTLQRVHFIRLIGANPQAQGTIHQMAGWLVEEPSIIKEPLLAIARSLLHRAILLHTNDSS
eukprot:1155596-Pelagomonas_calceolata.AAC.2